MEISKESWKMEDGCIKMQRCRVDLLKRVAFVSVILVLVSVGGAGATGNEIRVTYALDDLDDNSSNGDDYYQVNSTAVVSGANASNKLKLSSYDGLTPPFVPIAGNGLKFDANGDGDLKDSGDYVLYDGVYIIDGSDGSIRMGYNVSAHYVAGYYNISDGPKPGEVVKIKGSKYAITDMSEFDSGKIQMGPAIVKKISDTGTLDPARAVVIAENYRGF